jgi:predicted nucleic acid-binding protein
VGIGESECLAIAQRFGFGFISDDKRARNTALNILPKPVHVTGSIGLLCELIDHKQISPEDAGQALQAIQSCGGHLPAYDFRARVML